jgi:hypothetical protein
MPASKREDFNSFYQEYRDAPKTELAKQVKEREFNKLMKSGRTNLIVDWSKLLYGALSIAFFVKGVLLFGRE